MSSIISQLLEKDRKLKLHLRFLKRKQEFSQEVFDKSSAFLDAYCAHHQIQTEEVWEKYQSFLKDYFADLLEFRRSGKYPQELGVNRPIDRLVYDLPLIISVMVNTPRHLIMKSMKDSAKMISGKGAMIGVGPGLEIELMKDDLAEGLELTAYDTHLSGFPKDRFKDFSFKEELFHAEAESLDFIYAIELLEHLSEPYELVAQIAKCLKKGGFFFFTTATDMPQFDHLYNFTDDLEVQKQLKSHQLKIIEKTDHFHNYLGGPKSAKNTWYICKKEP